MNPSNPAVELQNATSRLLRCRLPLLFALLVNIVVVARWPLVQLGAVDPLPASIRAVAPAPPSPGQPNALAAPQSNTPESAPSASPPAIAESTSSTPPSESTEVAAGESVTVQEAQSPTTETEIADPQANSVTDTTEKSAPLDHDPSVTPSERATDQWWPAIESAWKSLQASTATKPSTTGLTLRNLPDNDVPVRFLVNGRVYNLLPGESHSFAIGTAWDLQYHRGGAYGNAHQTLDAGDYQFVVGSTGWTLEPVR